MVPETEPYILFVAAILIPRTHRVVERSENIIYLTLGVKRCGKRDHGIEDLW